LFVKPEGAHLNRSPEYWLKQLEDATRHFISDLKSGKIKRTLKVFLLPWGVVCQSEFRWNTKQILISPFRCSRGKRIWVYSEELLRQGIQVPEPVLFAEIKRAIFVTRSFIVFRWMVMGHNLAYQIINAGNNASDKENILNNAVETITRFHNAGFIHGDLKWGNVFSDKLDPQKIILTDLEGVHRTNSAFRQGIDFARFLLDGIRFNLDHQRLNVLSEQYLKRRQATKFLLKLGIKWRFLKKGRKYKKQGNCVPF
jgi:tRNA A-37 threonylcarbamoyl transferase component Bud32